MNNPDLVDEGLSASLRRNGRTALLIIQLAIVPMAGWLEWSLEDKFNHIDHRLDVQRDNAKDDMHTIQLALDHNSDAIVTLARTVDRNDATQIQLDRRITALEEWRAAVSELRVPHQKMNSHKMLDQKIQHFYLLSD